MTLATLPAPNFTGAELSARVNAALAEVRAARRFASVAALLADSSMAYGTGSRPVAEGDRIESAEGFAYDVAAAAAPDLHVSTAGGVRLRVVPGADGGVGVDAFGALGNGTADDSPAIQKAVAAFRRVRFGAKTYGIGAPVQFGSGTQLLGATTGEGVSGKTVLRKLGTTVGSGSNASPSGGGVTDGYAVNAILIGTHPSGLFNYNCRIEDLTLEGTTAFTTEFGIYAPRTTQWMLANVNIDRCRTGWHTFDSWQCCMERVSVNAQTIGSALAAAKGVAASGFASGTTRGFHWAKDGSGEGTGTTARLSDCWARQCHIGYDINNLAYSAFDNCAADDIATTAYRLESCNNLTLTGCGMEQVHCAPGLLVSAGVVNLVGHRAQLGMHGASGRALYEATAGATVTFMGAVLGDFATVNGALNRIIQEGSHVVEINTQVPANGNSYVSYSTGATLVTTRQGQITTASAAGSQRLQRRSPGPGGQLFGLNRAIAAAGTGVLTLTASGTGTRNVAGGELRLAFLDTSYPNGVVQMRADFACYREGTSYFQTVTAGDLARTGSDFTANPALAWTRVGNVWTLTVTPAHGDLTLLRIDLDWWEAATGDATLALL